MREALALRLEQLSYYHHLSLSGAKERPICAYRIIDIRGARFHVLSRIRDAALDFTGRTNFIAHHLVLAQEEIGSLPTPPVIFRDWDGWLASWTGEPRMLENENWSSLSSLTKSQLPARTWQSATGDAANAGALFVNRPPLTMCMDDLQESTVLNIFAESVELLEVRDARQDFLVAAWDYTFSTSVQEQDNPGDFRWRCVYSDSPAYAKLGGADCRKISDLRCVNASEEERAFAREGWKAPEFTAQPQNARIIEGETACFEAAVKGLPAPRLQWYAVNKSGQDPEPIAGATSTRLLIRAAGRGLTRYVLCAWNRVPPAVQTLPVVLQVEPKAKSTSAPASPIRRAIPADPALRSWEDPYSPGQSRSFSTVICFLAVVGAAIAGVVFYHASLLGPLPNPPIDHAFSTGQLKLTVKPFRHLLCFPLRYQWLLDDTTLPECTNASILATNVGRYSVLVRNWAGVVSNAYTNEPNIEKDAIVKLEDHSNERKRRDLSEDAPQAQQDMNVSLPPGWVSNTSGTVSNQKVEFIRPITRFDLSATGATPFFNTTNFLSVCTNNGLSEFRVSVTNWSTKGGAGIVLYSSITNSTPYLFIGLSNAQMRCWRYDGRTNIYDIVRNTNKVSRANKIELSFGFPAQSNVVRASFIVGGVFEDEKVNFPVGSGSNVLSGYAIFPSGTNVTSAQFRRE
jgi:hypothetical protein